MKTFEDFRGKIQRAKLTEGVLPSSDPPAVLILKRKYIRIIPGNIKIAVYWSDDLKQHITIPYNENTRSPAQVSEAVDVKAKKKPEELEFDKDNLAILKNIIVKNKPGKVTFSDGTEVDVEVDEANSLIAMYARLTSDNKKKVDTHLKQGVHTFQKLTKIAMES